MGSVESNWTAGSSGHHRSILETLSPHKNSRTLIVYGTRTSISRAVSGKLLGELFFMVQGLDSSVAFYYLEVLP